MKSDQSCPLPELCKVKFQVLEDKMTDLHSEFYKLRGELKNGLTREIVDAKIAIAVQRERITTIRNTIFAVGSLFGTLIVGLLLWWFTKGYTNAVNEAVQKAVGS